MRSGLKGVAAQDAGRARDAGFTLVEVLAAMVVLAILATSIMIVLGQSLQASRTSRQRVAAANLVAAQMDILRNAPVASLAVGSTTVMPAPVDGVQYTLNQTVRWSSSTAAETDTCSGPGTTLFKRVSITATWDAMGNVKPVRSDTVITPSIGDVNGNAITIPVRVRDSRNKPRPGVQVSLLKSASLVSAQFTDEYGCVVFANVTPGSYNATLTSSSSPATVDYQGAISHSESVGTSTAGTWLTTKDILWDTSATLTLTPTDADAQHKVPAGVGATIANTNFAGNPPQKAFAAAGASVSAAPLFPFTSGYDVWAGTCPDADPQQAGGGRASSPSLTPGGTLAINLKTQAVDVKATTAGGAAMPGRPVQALHAAAVGCSAQTYDLGVTDAQGFAKFALPYGTWTFRVKRTNNTNADVVKAVSANASAVQVPVTAS